MQMMVNLSHQPSILIRCSQRKIVIRTTQHMGKHIRERRYSRIECSQNIHVRLRLGQRRTGMLCLKEKLKSAIGETKSKIGPDMISTVLLESRCSSKQTSSMTMRRRQKQEMIGTLVEKSSSAQTRLTSRRPLTLGHKINNHSKR